MPVGPQRVLLIVFPMKSSAKMTRPPAVQPEGHPIRGANGMFVALLLPSKCIKIIIN